MKKKINGLWVQILKDKNVMGLYLKHRLFVSLNNISKDKLQWLSIQNHNYLLALKKLNSEVEYVVNRTTYSK